MKDALRHRRLGRLALLALTAAVLCVTAGRTQTLARPGWTGSGMSTEPWWRSAVFYRIAPEHFQDSDGDGVGDLAGIAQRLDYLQALGVDAIVLPLPFDDRGFDELLAEASRRRLRIVIGLERHTDGAGTGSEEALMAEARHWLARGAAGLLLPGPPAEARAPDPAEQMRRDVGEQLLLLALRTAAAKLPGERVVVPAAGMPVVPASGPAESAPARGTARPLRPDNPQLVLSTLPIRLSEPVTPSAVMAALTLPVAGNGLPLLRLQTQDARPGMDRNGPDPAPGHGLPVGNAEIAAAALLTQRSAVLLEYGQELGNPAPERMPWTPSNVTPRPAPPPETAVPTSAPPAVSGEVVYGPYRPYVPPPRPKPKPPAPKPDEVAVPEVSTLPGFSTVPAPEGARSAGVPSVAEQDRDPRSLLSLYRRLLALHHGNATLRSGGLLALADEQGAVVWVRQAPPGARTVAPVLVAVNCGDRAVTLSLDAEFAEFHLPGGGLRALLPRAGTYEEASSHRIVLGPHAVFVGELSRGR